MVKLVEEPGNGFMKAAEDLVREYADGFNKMDRRRPFIYTVERDEICMALDEILALISDESGVDKDKLIDLFDQLKEF